MIGTLTGLGLASAAGLNAYIPLLVVGLLSRYTELIPLGPAWEWLEHPATLICERDHDGASRIPAIDREQLEALVERSEDVPLGELWFSGALGGGL